MAIEKPCEQNIWRAGLARLMIFGIQIGSSNAPFQTYALNKISGEPFELGS